MDSTDWDRGSVQWSSSAQTPRYLFRVQSPSSIDSVSVNSVEARFLPSEEQKVQNLEGALSAHVLRGDSRSSNFVAWTSSFLHAIMHARLITTPATPNRAQPVSADNIELFILDTKNLPHGTFTLVWSRSYAARSDYLLDGCLDVRGRCARATLAELNDYGLATICRSDDCTRALMGGCRDGEDPLGIRVTAMLLHVLRAQQYVLNSGTEPSLEFYVKLVKIFPVELEIPMMVVFLSLGLPPSAEKVLEKIQLEFGSDRIQENLSDLGLDETQHTMKETSTFYTLATEIAKLKHDKDMGDLADFVRDVPFHEGHEASGRL